MGEEIVTLIGVFLLSAVKFGIGGVPAAVFAEYSFFKSLVVTISGGVFGTFFFAFFSEWVNKKLATFSSKNKKPKPKKKFTHMNKIIVYVKKYFGLIGISIITPLILSIPLGVFLAIRYYKDKQKVISYMIISIIAWSIILYFVYHSFRNLVS